MVAGAKQGKQDRVDGAHAGAGRDRRRATLQIGDRVFQRLRGRIPVTTVSEPGVRIGKCLRALIRVGEGKRRGLIDGDADRAGAVQLRGGCVDGAGFQVEVHGVDSARPARPAEGWPGCRPAGNPARPPRLAKTVDNQRDYPVIAWFGAYERHSGASPTKNSVRLLFWPQHPRSRSGTSAEEEWEMSAGSGSTAWAPGRGGHS